MRDLATLSAIDRQRSACRSFVPQVLATEIGKAPAGRVVVSQVVVERATVSQRPPSGLVQSAKVARGHGAGQPAERTPMPRVHY